MRKMFPSNIDRIAEFVIKLLTQHIITFLGNAQILLQFVEPKDYSSLLTCYQQRACKQYGCYKVDADFSVDSVDHLTFCASAEKKTDYSGCWRT